MLACSASTILGLFKSLAYCFRAETAISYSSTAFFKICNSNFEFQLPGLNCKKRKKDKNKRKRKEIWLLTVTLKTACMDEISSNG